MEAAIFCALPSRAASTGATHTTSTRASASGTTAALRSPRGSTASAHAGAIQAWAGCRCGRSRLRRCRARWRRRCDAHTPRTRRRWRRAMCPGPSGRRRYQWSEAPHHRMEQQLLQQRHLEAIRLQRVEARLAQVGHVNGIQIPLRQLQRAVGILRQNHVLQISNKFVLAVAIQISTDQIVHGSPPLILRLPSSQPSNREFHLSCPAGRRAPSDLRRNRS